MNRLVRHMRSGDIHNKLGGACSDLNKTFRLFYFQILGNALSVGPKFRNRTIEESPANIGGPHNSIRHVMAYLKILHTEGNSNLYNYLQYLQFSPNRYEGNLIWLIYVHWINIRTYPFTIIIIWYPYNNTVINKTKLTFIY